MVGRIVGYVRLRPRMQRGSSGRVSWPQLAWRWSTPGVLVWASSGSTKAAPQASTRMSDRCLIRTIRTPGSEELSSNYSDLPNKEFSTGHGFPRRSTEPFGVDLTESTIQIRSLRDDRIGPPTSCRSGQRGNPRRERAARKSGRASNACGSVSTSSAEST